MANVKWTNEQLKVINSRDGNLLVSAAAGSGKTAVLVERIIQMITDKVKPLNIDELLVVTFTNAAAGEMKERITEAITKKLEHEPENKHLFRQLNLMNHSSITTIHSFCLDVIRKHFHTLDIDPSFRIADETEIILLKNDVLSELIEEYYEKGEETFYNLVESYGGIKYDHPLESLVLEVYNFTRSYPWPNRWLDKHIESFNIKDENDLLQSSWCKELLEYGKLILNGIRESINKAIDLCNQPGGPVKVAPKFIMDLAKIDDLIAASKISYSYLSQVIKNTKLENIRVAGKDIDEMIKEKVSSIRKNQIKKPFDKLKEDLFFKDIDLIIKDIQSIYPILKTLGELVKRFAQKYSEVKKEKGLLDFNDIEHMALNLLIEKESTIDNIIPTQVALSLKEKYREILIDEYQDSNLVQELILNSISREPDGMPNIFMVGDVKQSIYRFRMAKPELFANKYETYSLNNESLYKRIDLSKNFRSKETILNSVNYIFENIMNKNIGEIIYDDLAKLYPGTSYPEPNIGVGGGAVEVNILDVTLEEDVKDLPIYDEIRELSNIELEAKLVSKKIQELFDPQRQFMVFDKKIDAYRPIEYRDIVILLRATSRWADIIVDELANKGIPVYAENTTGYFDTIEVKTILSLLKIIDNPRQDIPLITILRSPIVGLSVDELVEIRLNLKEGDFYDALICYSDGELFEGQLSNKIKAFLNDLDRWRKEAKFMNLYDFIWKVYLETDYYYYVSAMPGGAGRRANLDILIDKAIKFENSSYRGLFNFVRFIEKIKQNNGDFGTAKTLGPNENIVRIMSIHKSKGLEFPVVILAGMGKAFNTMDQKEQILLHQDLGFGPSYVDYVNRVSCNTLAKVAIRQRLKVESLSEEMRVLYVALTRAREKLILTGYTKSLENKLPNWGMDTDEKGVLQSYRSITASNYYDWIIPLLFNHKDGEILREKAGITKNICSHSSKWEINLWNALDLIEELNQSEDLQEQEKTFEDIKVNERLEWKYKNSFLNDIPIKITVTEIKKQSLEDDTLLDNPYFQTEKEYYKPKFIDNSNKISPADKGTIFHKIMYHLDFKNISTYQDINEQLNKFIKEGKITEEEKKKIYINSILNFSKTSIYKRLINSKKIEKEIPFVLGLKVNEIYENIDSEEIVMLQGVIDCYFEEAEEIVLLDYKTDYVSEDTIDVIVKRYKKQLDLYKTAIERITNKKVKEKYLYLASIGHAIHL